MTPYKKNDLESLLQNHLGLVIFTIQMYLIMLANQCIQKVKYLRQTNIYLQRMQ